MTAAQIIVCVSDAIMLLILFAIYRAVCRVQSNMEEKVNCFLVDRLPREKTGKVQSSLDRVEMVVSMIKQAAERLGLPGRLLLWFFRNKESSVRVALLRESEQAATVEKLVGTGVSITISMAFQGVYIGIQLLTALVLSSGGAAVYFLQ